MVEWPRASSAPQEDTNAKERLWAYFDAYKTPGKGLAVARPDLTSFTHVSVETRQSDQALLAQKRSRPSLRIQREHGPDAFAFENFLTSEAMRQRWFGGELSATTEYDDWVSGVDAVVEWPTSLGSPARMAIDFTSSGSAATFLKKSDKLEANTQVKYLRSRVETEQGKPKEMRVSMPLVLLGFDTDLYRFIAERQEVMSPDHPLRRLLLQQASSQIDLQIVQLAQKVFAGPRRRRQKSAEELYARFGSLQDSTSVDEVLAFIEGLRGEEEGFVMSEKDQQRSQDLRRLKERLSEERKRAERLPLDDAWQLAVERSKTHRILSW
jgi:hypothetical protein